ncbi:MAG: hypothetical protein AAF360_07190 [Pseudomonadota bacterium]
MPATGYTDEQIAIARSPGGVGDDNPAFGMPKHASSVGRTGRAIPHVSSGFIECGDLVPQAGDDGVGARPPRPCDRAHPRW